MIDLELTPQIKKWLDTEPSARDLKEGAELLLRVTRNRILYNNITRNPPRYADAIEYHLRKIYNQRVADITHQQVRSMMGEVEKINSARGLDKPQNSGRTELQRGKRADHDELPEGIRQLYVDNLDIMRRMRECHTRLRMISPDNSTCPDSDRYPWAKEIIALDRKYRENWNKYDHYIKGTPAAAVQAVTDPRTESRNAEKLCHLLLGKYSRTPDEALAGRIREAYSRILSPSDSLRKKMTDAGF